MYFSSTGWQEWVHYGRGMEWEATLAGNSDPKVPKYGTTVFQNTVKYVTVCAFLPCAELYGSEYGKPY